jgi:hypothetical protein
MKSSKIAIALSLTVMVWCAAPSRAQESEGATNSTPQAKPAQAAEAAEASYTRTIERRAADVLKALDLKAPEKTARVHDLLIGQYRALRDWHDQNDAKLKGAAAEKTREIKASLEALHEKFISSLAAVITPAQIDVIKDKMTYGKVQVTFRAYCQDLPNLTEAQKQKVLELLKQAREEAMDAGSSNEKDKIFRQYKGRINNYLSEEGVNASQADRETNEPPKEKAAPPGAKAGQ